MTIKCDIKHQKFADTGEFHTKVTMRKQLHNKRINLKSDWKVKLNK